MTNHRENKPVDKAREIAEAEEQRRIVNECYAQFRREHLDTSLRSLLELVEKKQCGTQ